MIRSSLISIAFIAVSCAPAHAEAEYNKKPVLCGTDTEILGMLSSKKEDLAFEAIQTTPVLDPEDDDDGVRDMPAMLPVAVYINLKEKTYSIVEYHPRYEQYCIVSLGSSVKFIAKKDKEKL